MTKSPRKNVPDVGIELGAACMPSELASDRATVSGPYERGRKMPWPLEQIPVLIKLAIYTNFNIRLWTVISKQLIIIEPRHDKTNKMTCVQRRLRCQPRHQSSLIRVFALRFMGIVKDQMLLADSEDEQTVRMPKDWPESSLGGWSESSLGAQVILLVLSCCGSIINIVHTKSLTKLICSLHKKFEVQPWLEQENLMLYIKFQCHQDMTATWSCGLKFWSVWPMEADFNSFYKSPI